MLLTGEDRKSIEETIRAAEAKTSGEIVFALADASSHYHHANLQGAVAGMALSTALYLALPSVHTVATVIWIEFLAFVFFLALFPYFPWRRWFVPEREMEARVREAAFMEFYSRGLYRTREANGILIFLSCFERRVVVMGDRGIHEKVGDRWDEVRDTIIDGIKHGAAREGICAAVELCGKALAQHFPPRPDDINELPNQVLDRPL